jgi:hypothetical protein
MRGKAMKAFRTLGIALFVSLAWGSVAGAQSWQPLTNQPTFIANGASNPLLLTDGTVIVHDLCATDWWRLTPDNTGSYVNGTWSALASLPAGYGPTLFRFCSIARWPGHRRGRRIQFL